MSTWTFSAADRVMACPASVALPQVRREAGAEAAHGTAVHAYLRDAVVDGVATALSRVPVDAPHRAVCERLDPHAIVGAVLGSLYHPDDRWHEAELAVAYDARRGTARKLGVDLGRRYPPLAPGEVAGSLDLLVEVDGHPPVVIDWKTGHNPPKASTCGQLMLAALAVRELLFADEVVTAIVHVDDAGNWRVDRHDLDSEALDAGRLEVMAAQTAVEGARALVESGRMPSVSMGPHCRYCPAMSSCPAQVGLARAMVVEELTPANRFAELAAVDAGRAWEQLQRAQRLLDEIKRALTARIDHDGSLPLPDGSEVRAQMVTRESIDAEKAIPVLAQQWEMSPHDVRALFDISVTKTKLEQRCRILEADPKTILGTLRAAGAIKSTSTTSYRVTKSKE